MVRKKQKNNKSGVNGVSWLSSNNTWRVMLNGKHVGCSKNFEEACKMRALAEWRQNLKKIAAFEKELLEQYE